MQVCIRSIKNIHETIFQSIHFFLPGNIGFAGSKGLRPEPTQEQVEGKSKKKSAACRDLRVDQLIEATPDVFNSRTH